MLAVVGLALLNAILYVKLDPSKLKLKANSKELLSIFDSLHHRSSKLNGIRTRLEVYDEIFAQMNLYEFITKELYEDRCAIYFNHLTMSVPDWFVNPHELVELKYEAFDNFDLYKNNRLDSWRQEKQDAETDGREEPKEPSEFEMKKDFDATIKQMKIDEQLVHDFASHVRVFDRCFLDGYTSESGLSKSNFVKQQRNFLKRSIEFQPSAEDLDAQKAIYKNSVDCASVENKIFPFISKEYPVFQRWDGHTEYFPGSRFSSVPSNECFLTNFKKRMNGKGIVLTIGDGQVDDAARLIRTLRFYHNKYPIQILYHGSLSDTSIERLTQVSREAFHSFPPQDIWFVNTHRSIKASYLNKFEGFANKLMAMLFNSFEEILFLDADAGLLKDADYFFNQENYKKTGTLFYRDRNAQEYRGKADIRFFSKMLPSIEDSVIFNIDQTSDYTLNNGFFDGLMNHFMESGIVVLNRKKHFIQPLMMSIISFYNLVHGRLYGDKEMFWLAVAISGRNDYFFNQNVAAAVGELMPTAGQPNPDMKAKQLCSAHPAHIDGNDNKTLVWVNSGFRFCSKSEHMDFDFKNDFENRQLFKWFNNLRDFLTFFNSPLVVTHALIPPHNRDGGMQNLEHEPENNWEMTGYCRNYLWCAYSRIGGLIEKDGEKIDTHLEGTVIELGKKQTEHFAKVASYWIEDLPWEDTKSRFEGPEFDYKIDIQDEKDHQD